MANVKISALPAATAIGSTDLLPVVQGGVTKQVTPDLLPISVAAATALAAKAGLVSPAFTGSPTIGGAAVAKTTDITAAISTLVGSAPAALDTLKEIDDQLTADEGSAAALAALVASKAALLTTFANRTASATLTPDTVNPIDATTAPLTVTLPTPTKAGQVITVEKVDATTNTVTVSGTIRGTVGTVALVWQYESLLLVAESLTSWRPVAGHKTKATLDAAYETKGAVAAQAAADAATYATQNAADPDMLKTLYTGRTMPTFGAHRCGANVYPENTVEGVLACIANGVDMLNVDTWPLIDGALGVMHDQTLARTTTSEGNITDLDAAGVQALVTDAGNWFGGGWGNLAVPLFSQVVSAWRGAHIPFAIEAKPTTGSGAALVTTLARYGLGPKSVMISSFNLQELAAPVAAGYTTQYVISGDPTAIATTTITNAGIKWVAFNITNTGTSASQAAKNAEVARWHAVGVKVGVYTCVRKSETWPWLAAGIDDIAADEPLYLRPTWQPLRTDPFASGRYFHGTISPAGTQSTSGRGYVGPTGYGRFAKTNTNGNFVVQGWGSPIAGAIESTLQKAVTAGATSIIVGPENKPLAGKALTIDPAGTAETVTPAADATMNTDGTYTITVPPLASAHPAGARVYGGTWTITLPITYDVMGTDTARWAGVVVGSPDDGVYADSGIASENGMLICFRASGNLFMSARKAGVILTGVPATVTGTPVVAPLVLSAGLTTTATTALTVTATPAAVPSGAKFVLPTGQVVTTSAAAITGATSISINSVTPTAAVPSGASLPNQVTLTIQRTATQLIATAGGVSITWTDTTWFGGYFHLGMNSQTAGLQVSYGGANKVTIS